MNKLVLGILIILVVLAFLWALGREVQPKKLYDSPAPATLYVREPIEIVKTFSEGVHTISGVVTLPTPCHTLSTETLLLESFPEQIVLQLTVTSPDEACIQVLSERTFEAQVEASENASLQVYVNGEVKEFVINSEE